MKAYTVTMTQQLCSYRTVTLTIDADDCLKAAQLAFAQAQDEAIPSWTPSDYAEHGHVDFEVTAADEPIVIWREDPAPDEDMNRIENNAPWLAGYNAGIAAEAYDVSRYAYEIQRAAYQRGYNAGCEDLIER